MSPSPSSRDGINSRSDRREAAKKKSPQPRATSPHSSPQSFGQGSRLTNPAHPGFFAGSSNVDASQGIFTDIDGNLNTINIGIQNNDPLAVLNKLRHAEGAGYQAANHGTCLNGTRTEELRRIEEWELDYKSKLVYWLCGISGSGKSTIAQTFAERSSAAGRLGASFFCSRDFRDRRDIRLIFPTIAYNLALQSPEFRSALIPIIIQNPDICQESLAIQLEKLLVLPLQSSGIHTTIIIDALDECEDNEPASVILSLLGRRIDWIPGVKFFITGRPEIPIRRGFRLPSLRPHTEVFQLHEIERESVDQDIELYLKTHLWEIVAERSHVELSFPWPANKDITVTIEKCAGLFIVASVIVKFVASRHHDPEERLKLIISRPDSSVHEGRMGIDGIYHKVLLQSFKDMDIDAATKFFVYLRLVIGSIVVAFNPLSCAHLAAILDVSISTVWNALRSLHSIFIVPDSELEPIRLCHKSLADYLTDVSRCADPRFYIELAVLHLELGLRCLRLMNASLKTNICDLPPYAMNADIQDLDRRRERHIGGGLEYGCRSWAMHLRLGSRDGDNVGHVVGCLKDFFSHHLLEWLEVLSIVGDMRCAVYSLQDLTAWLAEIGSSDADLIAIVKERFVLRFFDMMECSGPHIYRSALPLSPSSSLVRALYQSKMSTETKFNVIDDTWDASVRAIKLWRKVDSIGYSLKDDLIAVGADGVVDVFEAATGQRRATLTMTTDRYVLYESLGFSHDGTLLAAGDINGTCRVWDLQTGGLVGSLEGHGEEIRSVAFSPSGTMIATSSRDCTIPVWNTSTLDCQGVLEGHSDTVQSVCWTDTGKEVVSGSVDSKVKVWSVSDMRCSKTITIHAGSVEHVASSPNSSLVASGGFDGTIQVFDVKTGNVLHTFREKTPGSRHIRSVRFSNRGDQIMYATEEAFVIRDLTKRAGDPTKRTQNFVRRIRGLSGFTTSAALTFNYPRSYYFLSYVAISSDGSRLASFRDDVVKIWDTEGAKRNKDLTDHHAKRVWCISFSRDGQLIASGSQDGTVKIWHTSTGKCLTTYRGHSYGVKRVLSSPDSTVCASWDLNHNTRIWDVKTRALVSTLRIANLIDMCFSQNGSRLSSLRRVTGIWNRGVLELWMVTSGTRLDSVNLVYESKSDSQPEISFDVDGSTVIARIANETHRWKPSTTINNSFNGRFLPTTLPDPEQESVSPTRKVPSEYRLDRRSPWVVDKQKRRVLWFPPDLNSAWDSCGTRVVFGSDIGRVTIVDFTDVKRHGV